MLFLVSIVLCFSISFATDINYTNVTQSNFTEIGEGDDSVPGLDHLFVMTTNFINVVFQPFSVIEEFVFSILSNNESDSFLTDIIDQWQTLASFESGFVACFVAGVLFIILMPLVGLVMCCCRTCCDNCGGEMDQSFKRAKSGWRYCLTGGLLVCTIFTAVPCIFIYLTNAWANQALQKIPDVTLSALDDLSNYVDNIPTQIDHVIGEYSKLNESVRDNIDDIENIVGVPIRDEFYGYTNDTISQLDRLSELTSDSLESLQSVQDDTDELNTGLEGLNTALADKKTQMDSDLNVDACRANPACVLVQNSTEALNPTGANFSAVADLQSQIDNINNSLNQYDIEQIGRDIQGLIGEIPERVVNASNAVSGAILDGLDSVDQQVGEARNSIPINAVTELNSVISNISISLDDSLTVYSENYDVYRYAAGAVLASSVAIIVALYWFGLAAGTLSFSPSPSSRSGCSNCAGIAVMAGVGLTFIFSWLLMILVVLFFTIGGHGERYLCQNIEPPYEGLRFVDPIFSLPLNISLYDSITRCERNQSIYEAISMERTFNLTEFVQNQTDLINSFSDNLNELDLNTSNIDAYPTDLQDALQSMKETGFGDSDFTSYLDQIGMGLTNTNLTAYAIFLNASADNMTRTAAPGSGLEDLADVVRAHSNDILLIQRNRVAGLSDTLDNLNNSVMALEENSGNYNETIDSLDGALRDLNDVLEVNGTEFILETINSFAVRISDDVAGYMEYVLVQITKRFGACRPIFLVYSKMTSVLCSYLLELLNGFWFSLGWAVSFLLPSAILGMKLAKFYRNMPMVEDKRDAEWNEMEMEAMHRSNNNNVRQSSAKLREKTLSYRSNMDSLHSGERKEKEGSVTTGESTGREQLSEFSSLPKNSEASQPQTLLPDIEDSTSAHDSVMPRVSGTSVRGAEHSGSSPVEVLLSKHSETSNRNAEISGSSPVAVLSKHSQASNRNAEHSGSNTAEVLSKLSDTSGMNLEQEVLDLVEQAEAKTDQGDVVADLQGAVAASSQSLGDRRISTSTRLLKSSVDVTPRDLVLPPARHAVSQARNEDEVLKKWGKSSKVHPASPGEYY